MVHRGGWDKRSRLSAGGISALGSRLSALGSRLSALGSRLSALGSRLSALDIVCIGLSVLAASCRIVCIGDGVRRSCATLDMPVSRTAGHTPLALAGTASSLAPGPSPLGCAARHWPIAARRPGSVSANTALVCCDCFNCFNCFNCFIGRHLRWEEPPAQAAFASQPFPATNIVQRSITRKQRLQFHDIDWYSANCMQIR